MDKEILDRMMMPLMGASPTDDEKMASLDNQPVVQILPDANVVKIGGQSFIDRGRAAVFPLIDEVVENLPFHKMIIGTGAGTRARHAYSVGLDLGVPTGVLSVLGFFVSDSSFTDRREITASLLFLNHSTAESCPSAIASALRQLSSLYSQPANCHPG